VNRDPERIHAMMLKTGFEPEKVKKYLYAMQKEGILPPIDPRHIIINLVSLSVFPHLSKPIMKPMMFENSDEQWNKFMQERKQIILKMILK
jgi:hypothetical protein